MTLSHADHGTLTEELSLKLYNGFQDELDAMLTVHAPDDLHHDEHVENVTRHWAAVRMQSRLGRFRAADAQLEPGDRHLVQYRTSVLSLSQYIRILSTKATVSDTCRKLILTVSSTKYQRWYGRRIHIHIPMPIPTHSPLSLNALPRSGQARVRARVLRFASLRQRWHHQSGDRDRGGAGGREYGACARGGDGEEWAALRVWARGRGRGGRGRQVMT